MGLLLITTVLNLDIENLSVHGTLKEQNTNYYAWELRDFFENLENKDYQEKEFNNDLIKITNFKKNNIEFSDKPVNFSFDFEYEDFIEIIDDKLFFEPLLFLGKKVNDFNEGKREYPIDLEFPFEKKYIIYYKIPEGYKVESLPENKNFLVKDNIGELIFNVESNSTEIQIHLKVSINYAVILADYYEYLYTLFNEYIAISESKIVLIKI